MDFIKLTSDKLSIEEVNDKVKAGNCGAISLFVGTTRDNFEDKKVVTLEYEAYEPMANKAMKDICSDIRTKWKDVVNIAIYHRLGTVAVTESSVIIAISSPHRATALAATQHCIEALKKSVPIWKKEVYEADSDAAGAWKENAECAWSKKAGAMVMVEPVPDHLVQITCSNEEMRRRIDAFITRKRELANRANIHDFCGSVEGSCARIASSLRRQHNSTSHLRMQRIYTRMGPGAQEAKADTPYVSTVVESRVHNLERGLGLGLTEKPVPRDIYTRLRHIEDRILFLETLSPEYRHFWNKDFMDFRNETREEKMEPVKKKRYNVHDVDQLIQDLEKEAATNDS